MYLLLLPPFLLCLNEAARLPIRWCAPSLAPPPPPFTPCCCCCCCWALAAETMSELAVMIFSVDSNSFDWLDTVSYFFSFT